MRDAHPAARRCYFVIKEQSYYKDLDRIIASILSSICMRRANSNPRIIVSKC